MKVQLDAGAYLPDRARKMVLIGEKYGSLTVISDTGAKDKQGNKKFKCLCDCGNEVIRTSRYLHRKETATKSCGCKRGEAQQTHGYALKKGKSRLYRIWMAMKWRTNSKNKNANTYKKKGVKCCQEWMHSFESFRNWALNNGYNDTLTLDRIDNNGNYTPENCRWVDCKVQANNKSNNTIIVVDGKAKTMSEWSQEKGINYSTLRSRYNRQHLRGSDLFASTEATRDIKTGRFVGGYAK